MPHSLVVKVREPFQFLPHLSRHYRAFLGCCVETTTSCRNSHEHREKTTAIRVVRLIPCRSDELVEPADAAQLASGIHVGVRIFANRFTGQARQARQIAESEPLQYDRCGVCLVSEYFQESVFGERLDLVISTAFCFHPYVSRFLLEGVIPMKLVTLRGITTLAIASMALVHGARAADNTGATLIRPKQNAKVEKVSEVSGRVLKPGWPVVLVRADQTDCLWWSQDWPVRTSPGHFKAQVRFGNQKTRSGQRFRVVVLMTETREDAKRFQPGTSFKELPEDLPISEQVTVVLERPEDRVERIPDVIQRPEAEDRVPQKVEVIGNSKHDGQPVVMVRCAEINSPWWVQPQAAFDGDETFRTLARFGNAKTAPGTRFRMVVIFPSTKQAESLVVGQSMKNLPSDVPRSDEVEVIRGPVFEAEPATATGAEK